MRFADPELFLLLLVVLPMLWVLRRDFGNAGRGADGTIRLPSLAALHVRDIRPNWRARTLPYIPLLRIAGIVLIIVALARPQTSDAQSTIPAEGIDIILTLDVSRSMIQQQLGGGTRLDGAREVARDFVARRGNDRVGIVVFQSESLVLSPLTLDLDAIDTLLAGSVRNGLLREGTALGLALAESIDLLRNSEAPSRVVVALTDGEDNIRIVRPVEAAAIARALDIRVYTIGVTRPDASATTVDELALRFIAEETGAQYFRATERDELEDAYAEIDALEKAHIGTEDFTRFVDLTPWLLVPGIILILLELGAHATWWRRAP